MKILLFSIFLSYLSYGQNKIVNTPFLERSKVHQIYYSENFQPNTYVFKYNSLVTRINKNFNTLNKKTDFYKTYFKANNTTKEKQVVFKAFSPQFNSTDFSIPLEYKYKNGSICFYLLKGCEN